MTQIGVRTASLNQQLPAALGTAGRLGYDGLEVVTRDPDQLRSWVDEVAARYLEFTRSWLAS